MQPNFFDPPTDEIPALPPPEQPATKRVFLYDNQVFEDPGAEYSVQDILNFLASTYPELATGTWTSRTRPDGTEEITFVKVTGEKGSDFSPGQLLAALQQLSPTDLRAVALLDRLTALENDESRPLTPADLLALSPDIERALQQAERIAGDSQRIVAQCLHLSPVPQPTIPLGF